MTLVLHRKSILPSSKSPRACSGGGCQTHADAPPDQGRGLLGVAGGNLALRVNAKNYCAEETARTTGAPAPPGLGTGFFEMT
jgi:hypothetical protein